MDTIMHIITCGYDNQFISVRFLSLFQSFIKLCNKISYQNFIHDMTPEIWSIKNDKLDFIKIKTFCSGKDTANIIKWASYRDYEKIFSDHTSEYLEYPKHS